MKDIQVYVKVERYIKEWLEFHLGNPVRFPERSYENELLHRHLAKRPCGLPPEKREDNMVAIVITDCDHSRPEYYNYLGQRGQRAIVSAIDALFRLDLWSGCAPLLHSTRNSTGASTDGVPTTAFPWMPARPSGRNSTASANPIWNAA